MKILRWLSSRFCFLFLIFLATCVGAVYPMDEQNLYSEDVRIYYGDAVYIKNAKTKQYVTPYFDSYNSVTYLVGVDSKETAFKILSAENKKGAVLPGDKIYFEFNKDGTSSYICDLGKSLLGFVYGSQKNLLGLVSDKNKSINFKILSSSFDVSHDGIISLLVDGDGGKDRFFRFNVSASTFQGGKEIFISGASGFLSAIPDSTKILILEKKVLHDLPQKEQEALRKKIETNLKANRETIKKYYNFLDCSASDNPMLLMSYDEICRKLDKMTHVDKETVRSKLQNIRDFLLMLKYFNENYYRLFINRANMLADFSQWPKITKDFEEVIGRIKRELSPTLYYEDAVYIKNVRTKKVVTLYANEKEKVTYLVVGKTGTDGVGFVIKSTEAKTDKVMYGDTIQLEFKNNSIGDLGKSKQLLYGITRTLLGLVPQDNALSFKILPIAADSKKVVLGKTPVLSEDKIQLQLVGGGEEFEESKKNPKFFRFNVDAGKEIFVSDDSKWMTSSAIKGTKELTFKKAV